MSRTPANPPEFYEQILGPRGSLNVETCDKVALRKWFISKGIPAKYGDTLKPWQKVSAYNKPDTTTPFGVDWHKAQATKNGIVASEDDDESEETTTPTNTATAIPATDDPLAMLEILKKLFGNSCDEKKVREIIRQELPGFIPTTRIELVTAAGVIDKGEHLLHRLFHVALATVQANVPLLNVGPAGAFKSTTAETIAKVLNMRFFMKGAASGSHEYLGFVDAYGKYHSTGYRESFQNGGVFNAAELDGGSADVPLVVNNGVANGHQDFPDSVHPVKRHADFRIIADTNTWGNGADRTYVGRTQLDGATIDRFAFLDFRYDESMEMAIVTGKGTGTDTVKVNPPGPIDREKWVRRVQSLRHAAEQEQARIIISPRASINGAKLLEAGISQHMVEDMVIWKGTETELRQRIERRAA